MQTILLEVQDNYIKNNSNIIDDPYFYERKKELNKIRDEIKNNQNNLVSFDEFKSKSNKLEKEFKLKYGY